MRMIKSLLALTMIAVVATSATCAQSSDISELVESLKSPDIKVQRDACKQLSDLGPGAVKAVPSLVRTLEQAKDVELLKSATLALAAVGPEAREAVPALVKSLKSDDSSLAAHAAYALGRIGKSSAQATPALVKLATAKDPVLRRAVRNALKNIGVPRQVIRPLLIQALKTADPADAAAALATLTERGEEIVPDICDALEDKAACYWACLAVAELGPKAKPAVPHLAKLLDSDQPEVRMQALMALASIGPAAKDVAPAIAQRLDSDKFESVQYAAAYALGSIGNKSEAILNQLASVLDSKNAFLRVTAAWAILKLDDPSDKHRMKAVAVTLKGLQSDIVAVRAAAARTLVDEEFTKGAARSAIRKALEGIDDPEKLMQIVEGLAAAGPKVVPACIQSLRQRLKLRYYAIQVLIKLGPAAADAVPVLIETLDDSDPAMVREAAFALGAIGARAAAATEKLVEKLDDESSDVRNAACYALGKIGPPAKAALPRLEKMMQSDNAFTKLAAVWASLKIDSSDQALVKRAIPLMVAGLADVREHVRVEMAYELGELGEAAQPAVEALKKALTDSSPAVRVAAAAAIEQIEAASKR